MKKESPWRKISNKFKISFFILMTILTFSIISCNPKSDSQNQPTTVSLEETTTFESQNDSIDAVIKSIIDISAKDFYENQQPLPVEFRNVQIKFIIKPTKEMLYILCGQFLTKENPDKDEWTQFATIKNSEYEQWIGNSGLAFCQDSKEIPYTKTDLSSDLKKRLNYLQDINE